MFLFYYARLAVAGVVEGDSYAVDVLGFAVAESALGLNRHPIIKLFLILFHPLILFKLHNLLRNKIIRFGRLSHKVLTQKVMILGQGQIGLQLLLILLELLSKDVLTELESLLGVFLLVDQKAVVDGLERVQDGGDWLGGLLLLGLVVL